MHGHNGPSGQPLQWQTPHLPQEHGPPAHDHTHEVDVDLVEAAFVEGFGKASDPTSFLRLARIPFRSERNGRQIELVRVRIEVDTDIAVVTPYQGGQGHRVAPLPARLVGHRRRLRFVFLDEGQLAELDLEEVRALPDLTPPT